MFWKAFKDNVMTNGVYKGPRADEVGVGVWLVAVPMDGGTETARLIRSTAFFSWKVDLSMIRSFPSVGKDTNVC